jgi:putative nucleotidyltransferase with HDIG domain/PAS domain S-box-containing protein
VQWADLVHPDDRAWWRKGWDRAMRGATAYESDFRIRRADGEYRWVAARGTPVPTAAGAIRNWVGTLVEKDTPTGRDEEFRRVSRTAAEVDALLDTLEANAPVGFLFVDREFRYVRVNEALAAINGLPVEQHLGRLVAEVVPDLWPQIEPFYRRILDGDGPVLDVPMTGETAATGAAPGYFLASYFPVLVDDEVIGISVMVVEITERIRAHEAMVSLTEAAVEAVAAAVEARDPYTAGHQRRVAALAVAIARDMGIDDHAIEGIRLAAKIHDIGKISVPAEILSKPARLSPAELTLVQQHARAGYDIVRGIDFPWPIAEMILQHHERRDGSGYPAGLTGAEIGIGAQIIAVADVMEALASHRPYRASKGIDAAMEELARGRGTRFDAGATDSCLRLFREGRFRFEPTTE